MVPLSGSLKVTFRMPVPVLYCDDAIYGGMVSGAPAARTSTSSPRTAPMWLPDMSTTAPSIMYSIGANPTASVCSISRVACMVVSEAVPTDTSFRVYRRRGSATVISG